VSSLGTSGFTSPAAKGYGMSQDTAVRVAELLHQAGDVHHTVFADTDGSDDDWATFYSDWLLAHSDLPRLLAKRPVRSHLTRDLVELDEAFTKQSPGDPWPMWYAARLVEKYG
jgi:hypothetical protein